jgi:aldehyde dehydrogenase (NAD+)
MVPDEILTRLNIEHLCRDGRWASLYRPGQAGIQHFTQEARQTACSPINGATLSHFHATPPEAVDQAVLLALAAFREFQLIPPPRRGELVHRIGLLARERKPALAELIIHEVGKIRAEALGEVQELIDICDFAQGLSRQLYGLTIGSERASHRMMEQWHPLSPVGILTAFNFPIAVWAWNALLALVCGNTLLWKPSAQTPLCALACQQLVQDALGHFPEINMPVSTLLLGGQETGRALVANPHIKLISATGSCAMGRAVGQQVAARLGRSLLELGGNNAMIVTPRANLELALRAIVFSAVGTAGQRCTSLRRLIVHEKIHDRLIASLCRAYESLRIGDPTHDRTLMGPLIHLQAWEKMQHALQQARQQGAECLYGGNRITAGVPEGGLYVKPAILSIRGDAPILQEETFAPVLWVIRYQSLDDAIEIHNNVPQGLSSAIFTDSLAEAEIFLSQRGSDCGIANVNVGTTGAEIGGAFGGEKQTGGGRESGSDAWKNYMRRTTNTVNFGTDLPLAQGIQFHTRTD